MAYIVMTAPGHYGDYATIYSRHETLEAAIKARGNRKGCIVADDGGFPENHQPGMKIHRQFAAAYSDLSRRIFQGDA